MNEIEKQIENINKEKEKSILELLKDEKVEWRKLGEVCEIVKGKQFNKRDMLEKGKYPVINGGILPSGYVEIYNQEEEKITISQGGASAGYVNFIETKFWLGAHAFAIIPNSIILNRYAYHFLKQQQIKLQEQKEGAGIPSISKEKIFNLEVPIPRIEIQEKIIKILDKFTKYVTELQAELQARNKQYIYYRDLLLSEDYLTKLTQKTTSKHFLLIWEELANIIKIKNGRDWKNLGEGSIPVYGSGGEMGVYVDKMAYNKPTVLIPRKGSIENVFYLDKPFWNVDTIFYAEINEEKIIPKYFYYFIQSFNIKSLSTDSTRPSITQTALNKVKIPLPPIEIQEKIILVLDKFQKLVDETNGLLPEEIEQRKKQYEYYREKLLTFNLICDN